MLYSSHPRFLRPTLLGLTAALLGVNSVAEETVSSELKQKLWLPASYARYMGDLIQSAQQVSQFETCRQVIRGELLESQSTAEHPVFRVLCRDQQGQSYAVLVDGDSYEDLHAHVDPPIEEQKGPDLPQYARVCVTELKAKVHRMIKPVWPESDSLAPTLLNDDVVDFEVDFTAENAEGILLKYRGYCHFNSLQELSLDVKPRPGSQ
ncbi:hypothetical protein [Halioxenophilus sp. WMMB6]|uniref:hypothetical protein n=1 Tax=Halioxenophilus sp. WMMB6 TaxID=3073815 RepID=UPI00295E42E1|nr:hypothetical protein [Halioxenophilus sp. WMMB6]